MVMQPEVGSYQRSNRPIMVLLPQPLAPTRAVVFPAGMDRLKSRSTSVAGREAYANFMFWISILPRQFLNVIPASENGSNWDGLSINRNSSAAAAAAFVIAVSWGKSMLVADDAINTERATLYQ